MRPPLFQVRQEVQYHGHIGAVAAVFSDGAEGYRYYIDQGRSRWSAPEWALSRPQSFQEGKTIETLVKGPLTEKTGESHR